MFFKVLKYVADSSGHLLIAARGEGISTMRKETIKIFNGRSKAIKKRYSMGNNVQALANVYKLDQTAGKERTPLRYEYKSSFTKNKFYGKDH